MGWRSQGSHLNQDANDALQQRLLEDIHILQEQARQRTLITQAKSMVRLKDTLEVENDLSIATSGFSSTQEVLPRKK